MITLARKKLLIAVLCLVVAVSAVAAGTAVVASATVSPKTEFVVVIDAGHGGIDGGVVGGTTGESEAVINLAIAKKLASILRDSGIGVVLTRTTEAGLYGVAGKGQKMRDMQARARIINGAGADLVVSIHQNSFPSATERGAQVFFRKGNERGRELARILQRHLNATLPASTRESKVGDFYVLNCTDVASVLVECGFLSNPTDERNLLTDAYQERVAYTIYLGITSYLRR